MTHDENKISDLIDAGEYHQNKEWDRQFKEALFGCYSGQQLVYFGEDMEQLLDCHLDYPDTYLRLKPLSSITDDDAKELFKIKFTWDKGNVSDIINIISEVSPYPHDVTMVNIKYIILHKYWGDFTDSIPLTKWYRLPYQYADFLRSRGYALPFRGITVAEQIKRRFIKLDKYV